MNKDKTFKKDLNSALRKTDVICSAVVLKMNHILFWWYYKRVPKFFHKWTILKSISLLKQNYEHEIVINKGLNEVINSACETERKLKEENSNLKLKLMGVSQDVIDPLNTMLGVNLKGKSAHERDN